MDGMAQFESRMAHSDRKPFDKSQSRSKTVYANSVPRRTHNRTQSATDDITDHHSTNFESHTRSVIGPSASIPECLGQTNGAGVGAYADEIDGLRMSKNYNLADAELKSPKVELLTFKPLVEEEAMGTEGEGIGQPNESDMTLSQQEFVSDIDAKIGAMLRNRKVSERSGRVHKPVAPPTRANMKEVMNMTPGTKKKTSYSEGRKPARNSVHGVPWEMDKELEVEETRKERESRLQKKLEKKQQRVTKAASAVLVGYYPKKEAFDTSPSIPEEGDSNHPLSTQQLTSTPLFSIHNREVGDTLSTSASFEFASPHAPPPSSTHTRSLSPTQELVPQMDIESPSRSSIMGSVSRSESTSSGKSANARFDQGQGRTVYRPNLADTHLSDVAVFGKHFDPSQATQERMEANVGDVSMIGLNPTTSPVKSKTRERERRRDSKEMHSGSLRLQPREVSKSASASPRRTKNKTRLSSLRSGDQEREELTSWEQQLPSSVSFNSAILSTPSRYKMNRVSHGFREPTYEENGDVFGDEVPKGSMPDIFRRPALSASTFSSSHEAPRGNKEGTPDSGASDDSKSKRRRSIGFSFGRKLSTSMKELFVKDKKSPTSKTTWHFETGDISQLYPAPSEPQLSILTEQERKEILEETEIVPRPRSTEAMSSHRVQPVVTNDSSKEQNPLAHLFVAPSGVNSEQLAQSIQNAPPTGFFEERSVDGPPSKNRREESDEEYETASDSEENHVKSVVSIITQPTASDTALREAGYFASSAETGAQKDVTTPQAVLRGQSSPSDSYKMPASEGDPIVKTLDGVVDKSRKDIGSGKIDHTSSLKSPAYSKSKHKDKTTVDGTSKDKKLLFGRFSKQQKTSLQPQSPSPRALSPSFSVSSRQSSGRLSPSRKLSNNSLTENIDNTRRGSNTSVGSSPRGSFRGGLSAGGRVSPGGNFRRGVNSPARGSGRGTVTMTVASGLNSQRGGTSSPTPGGLNSPRGSFRSGANTSSGRGSQQLNTRGLKIPTPGGRGSPMQRNSSPRSSFHASPPSTRKDLSSTTKSSASRPGASHLTSHTHSPTQNRRSSEPISPSGTPSATPKRLSGERGRGSISSTRETPKPVRQAPPPPLKSGTSPSISRTSSQASATSSGSSPRQRKKGMSMPESPVSPQKFSVDVQLQIPAPIGEESSVKNDQGVDKLLSTVSQKLAPLSASPEEPNPLDQQTEFEIPPRYVEKTSLTPPPHAAVPTNDLASSHDSQGGDVATPDIVVTPEDSPVPPRKGPRPKTIQVISSLIGRKKGGKDSPAPKSKGTSSDLQQTGQSSLRKSKPPTGIENGRASPSTKKITVTVNKTAAPKEPPSTKSSLPTGLPPRGSSVRKSKTGASSRSMSTIEPPAIQVTEARKSFRKMSTPATGSLTTGGPKASRLGVGNQSSLARSSIRVTGKLKKNNPTSPEHRKASTLNRPKSGDRPPSRGSVHSLPRNASAARSSVRRPARVAPVAPGRAPMRKMSSGSEVANRNRSSSLTVQNVPRPRQSVISKSMRKTSTLLPPSQAGDSLKRTTATRSMRMSSSRKVSSLGTMPRASVVSRLGGPASTGNLQSPAARKSMRKTSSAKDAFDVFDQISADAKGNLLTSSDHRRAVRPKLRQKASTTHLKMLHSRKDITSEMASPSESEECSGLDPNTYSTYMGKKNLAPSAVAGLAMKLDLTTVKLRETGITDKMLSERSVGEVVVDLKNHAVGAEFDTKHPTLLLQIKGRRQVHTRLVEPSVTSMNSGDVYICVSGKSLYHWVGKSANVIEKARGSDVAMRIVHKKELGCQAMVPVVIKEELVRELEGTAKMEKFWELLGGKKGVKSSESVPNDDLYEKSVNMVTKVMQLEGTDDKAHFTTIHENSNHMLKIALLDTKKILLLDFYSEVYVWVGKMSPAKLRKKAIELARKHFDAGCKPPVFTHQGAGGSTVVRSSGRYRAKVSSTHNPRNNSLTRSGRRVSRVKKESINTSRPSWAMFGRINEGAEHILFREKFSDWPEQGRIIKMKGHSTGPVMPSSPVELQPADVEKMLRPIPKFEGLRLEGDNVHRGQGNYKVSRSTFACNRVHPNKCTKWVIKDSDNVVVPESDHGLFYVQEAYVIRWSYRITVVKELEGLTPGEGMFAKDRKRQKEMNGGKGREVSDAKTSKGACGNDSSDTESEGEEERDEESQRILESGGRDKVAYFFWQGDHSTINEKGASALFTVELDKERGPQVRVLQSKEPPAFLNLFCGGMVILNGRSETLSLKSPARTVRLFLVRGQTRNEACLVEIDPEHWPLAKFLRSRGCYVVYDSHSNKVYLWKGCKITDTLKKVSHTSARLLRRRLKAELVMVEEGNEPKDLCALIGDKTSYDSLLNDTRLQDFTPRLFELSSTTGEFVASEVLYSARDTGIEAAPFLQSDLYSATQPAIFLLDAYRVIYIWLGWWPQERRDWSIMRETNITTGSAQDRWLRDKKLALQTAQLYAKASTETRKHQPKTYMIHAGTEPDSFINLFPFWKQNTKVQDLQCKGRKPIPQRIDVDEELLKYSRTQFTLKELQKRPLPEGVDPSKLETYISDNEFETVFKITREQFKKFPAWKQAEIKKRHCLF